LKSARRVRLLIIGIQAGWVSPTVGYGWELTSERYAV